MGLEKVALLPQAEPGDEFAVGVDVLPLEVAEESVSLTDHHDETTPAVMIMLMVTQMASQVLDFGGQHRDLDLGRTRVLIVPTELAHDLATRLG